MNRLAADLAQIVGTGHVITAADVMSGYTTDWTRRYRGHAVCVARPASSAEVAEVLRCCGRHGAAVVPQGGNTGLVAGSVPPPAAGPGGQERPCVLLSLRRLDELGAVDTLSAQVTAGAGVTIAGVAAHAAASGLAYGVDLAARDSATVGGTIAVNAGGIHTIRYGPTRAQVLGVEAVLADGSVLSHLAGLTADNTGYDLSGLLVGSEGTLAVITAARLRLCRRETVAAVVIAGVSGIGEAARLLARLRAGVPGVRAAEYFEAAGVELLRQASGLPLPLRHGYPAYLLAEIAGAGEDAERLAAAGLPADAAVALDGAGQARLWAYRERHTEVISAAGVAHKLDVAVPLDRLAEFRGLLNDTVRMAAGPDCQVIVFGHIGAGNLHINLLGLEPGDNRADDAVLRLVAAHEGTISAEHGIGRAKAPWLHLSRTPAEIAAMRAVKTALDPAGMLNPGVLLP